MGSWCLSGVSAIMKFEREINLFFAILRCKQRLKLVQRYVSSSIGLSFSLVFNGILWKPDHVYRKIFNQVITHFLFLAIRVVHVNAIKRSCLSNFLTYVMAF